MSLRYKKRIGSKNIYTTVSYSSATGKTNRSYTQKSSRTTLTKNGKGTRVTTNLGNGWSKTMYMPHYRVKKRRKKSSDGSVIWWVIGIMILMAAL